jgi:hypothetical protein
MYSVSDVVEMGKAQDLILGCIKDMAVIDDFEPMTLSAEEPFDE